MYYSKPYGNGLGITALVLGIVGIAFAWIPVLNYATAVAALVGLVLGAIGMFRGRNQWLAAWGTVLSAAAIMLSVVVNVQFARDVEREIDKIERDFQNCQAELNAWDPLSGKPTPNC